MDTEAEDAREDATLSGSTEKDVADEHESNSQADADTIEDDQSETYDDQPPSTAVAGFRLLLQLVEDRTRLSPSGDGEDVLRFKTVSPHSHPARADTVR